MNLEKIKAIIFDIDNTLVYGDSTKPYYSQYSKTLEQSIAQHLAISLDDAKNIADDHRAKFNGMGEKALETHSIPRTVWYDALSTIEPRPHLQPNPKIIELLVKIKAQKITLGAVTDSPIAQAKKVLKTVSLDPTLFDFIIGWERDELPPKGGHTTVYENIMKKLDLQPHEILMVGDSLGADIIPAQSVGYQTFHVSKDSPTELLLKYL